MHKKILLVLFLLLPLALAQAADLLIAEIQITGGAGKTTNDYVKIYNNTDNIFDLAGYRLVKRTKTGLSDTTIKSWTEATPVNPRGFYLWANSENGFATSLNADASTTATLAEDNSLAIRQGPADTGPIIDAVAWGLTSDNSLGLNNHWLNPDSGKITIDLNNKPSAQPPADLPPVNQGGGGIKSCQILPGLVVINELVSMPNADEKEWVELYNNCEWPVKLDGWQLTDGNGTATKLSGSLEKFLIIEAPKGQLNNAGDLISLEDNSGQLIDQILYGHWEDETGAPAPTTGQSLARNQDGLDTNQINDFALTDKPTKSQANIINLAGAQPSGKTLSASSSQSAIILTEIMPDPLGSDDQDEPNGFEFIEIFNQSDKTVNLQGWRLVVGEQNPYTFGSAVLEPKNYLALKRTRTNLKLNNDKETIKLFEPDALNAAQTLSYRSALENLSYNYSSATKQWAWSLTKTPGRANVITPPNQAPRAVIDAPDNFPLGQTIIFDGSDSFDPEGVDLAYTWEFSDGFTSHSQSVEKILSDKDLSVKLTVSDGALSDSQTIKLKNNEIKTAAASSTPTQAKVLANKTNTANQNGKLKLNAIAVVEPGLFGSQYFYAIPLDEADRAADAAIQIYNSKKDFPQIKQGDYFEVQGELYNIANDERLKIASAKDITILDHGYLIVEKRLESKELKAELHNQIITVSGKITEKKSNGFFLDDGGGEIWIELKTGTKLSAKHFIVGNRYQITGLLRQETSGLKLWPRSDKDIVEENQTESEVAGAKISQTTSSQPVEIKTLTQNQEKLWQYLAIAACGVSLSLLVLLIKPKTPKQPE